MAYGVHIRTRHEQDRQVWHNWYVAKDFAHVALRKVKEATAGDPSCTSVEIFAELGPKALQSTDLKHGEVRRCRC
jgi:hypothetical protein